MKKNILTTVALLILIGGGIAAYFYFQNTQPKPEPKPETVEIQEMGPATILPDSPEPVARQVLIAPSEKLELPQLESTDNFMANALGSLVNNKKLMNIFINDQLIHNIVVTIDNLPRKQVSMRVMPIKKALGRFMTMESEGEMVISPENNARYAPYMQFAEAVDPKQLVTLYVQLYPLFQETYEELGYPDQYFNDRMMLVLNNLLTAPEVTEPVQLVQPKFYYQYADPALESRSIGQRILMRIGSDNEKIIKTKLTAIKQELMLHMHEQKIE